MRPISEVLSRVLESIREANLAFNTFHSTGNSDYREEQEHVFKDSLESAFLELKLFLEVKGALHLLQALAFDHEKALGNLMRVEVDPASGEPFSRWARRLYQYWRAVDTTFGVGAPSTVTKDLVDILRATVYSITDSRCFSSPPTNESEVHARIEAVLRCVFVDLRHKPPIGKPIKNFEPDTGIPSLRTLIEYKFVGSEAEAKRVAEEVLADTRGYISTDWDKFVYVIYETKRLKPEDQWRQLLISSGVADNTQIIVISGEEPRTALSLTGSKKPKRLTPAK